MPCFSKSLSASVMGRITLQGTPAASTPEGISRVTTLPAAITVSEPIVTPPRMDYDGKDSGNGTINVEDYGFAEESHAHERPMSIQEVSEELIKAALKRNGGKRSAAANELGISERTLYRKIKEFNIKL